MKVYRNFEQFSPLPYAVVTMGMYDGVHKGHQKILTSLVNFSRQVNAESVVITFWPHPRKIIGTSYPDENKYLSPLDEKIFLLEQLGIDHLLIISFNREFSELNAQTFVEEILVKKIGAKKIIVGYDHRFGKNREGSYEFLAVNAQKYGFEVEEISRQDLNENTISSTEIRNSLSSGFVERASQYLGREYSLKGIVVKGKQLGRTIGFPTANIKLNDLEKLLPTDGVYVVKIIHKGVYLFGMMNIGIRPTLSGKERTIEVNIFDFDSDIYGEELEVFFLTYIRPEQKFDGLDQLKKQLYQDMGKAKAYIADLKQ